MYKMAQTHCSKSAEDVASAVRQMLYEPIPNPQLAGKSHIFGQQSVVKVHGGMLQVNIRLRRARLILLKH